ncbi:3-beta hydroxysteroid dehydrogenase/isomerase [Corchorus capsularis]|uniref:3-beta hydroxysteroid dehydrogenase/isomerase n=1 Tax=Corchorus capsularis TaxID=210143 RepID=A0A1R3INQ6_COCAP|nr:3-beta hydroxysteroid dehydrogenase/isomerase [Corchorus capsularis]
MSEPVVCVTGASGFIASWIVKLLLQYGYTVKATVRDPSVFHTTSPCYYDPKDPQVELIDPAVKGTLNVLRSCAKVPSIKRMIITSSLRAVVFTGKPLADNDIVDETWFSDPDFCEKLKLWYMLSKTLAEKAAWNFAEEHDETIPWMDVRDVANTHILAFENSSTCGRYCITGKPMHSSELVQILRELYPTLNLPKKCADENQLKISCQFSLERVKSLGINFIPLELSLKDTVESLKENSFL